VKYLTVVNLWLTFKWIRLRPLDACSLVSCFGMSGSYAVADHQ
jgi:hypothetical protein